MFNNWAKTQTLEAITAHLERLEEKIIFKLLNRAQYHLNLSIYRSIKKQPSLFMQRLKKQEKMDAAFGRYDIAEERPFTLNKINKKPPKEKFLKITNFNKINLTTDILQKYFLFIKKLCQPGTDKHFGSSIEHDVYALQAISERIHFAAFYVAETKFQQNSKLYVDLIKEKNHSELYKKLTRAKVEENIKKRVEKKAQRFQQGINKQLYHFVDPQIFVDLYCDLIIPITKQGEILYFLNRKN